MGRINVHKKDMHQKDPSLKSCFPLRNISGVAKFDRLDPFLLPSFGANIGHLSEKLRQDPLQHQLQAHAPETVEWRVIESK